jgi:tricorn protease
MRLIFLALILGPVTAVAQTPAPTRMLAQPAVSASHVAFVYAGDVWTAKLDGSDVRRVSTADGDEGSPVLSDDGQWLAFAGNYDGNVDVYVAPVAGGEVRRLTWHPGNDLPQAFTRDGKRVLFTSNRTDWSQRYTQLWTVAIGGGPEEMLPIPNGAQAAYSPDGRSLAYNPIGRAFEQWKSYRGGRVSQLWLINTNGWDIEKVPQPQGHSNDVDGMWLDANQVWFRSDREGEFNIYKYDRGSKAITRVTNHTDLPVMSASSGGGKIVYEQAGWLFTLDPMSGKSQKLAITVPADLRETRPRWVEGSEFVRGVSPSPTGARLAFEMRGEIVTVPAEKGDPRNLTNTPGANEKSPAWSPDGQTIAYFSDQGGENRLHIAPADGKGQHRVLDPQGAGFYFDLIWSPDGKRMAWRDNSQSIFVLDVPTARVRKVASNKIYSPQVAISFAWSSDSRWLAYTNLPQALVSALYLYDADNGRSTQVTDGLAAVSQPAFDRNGKYLYVLASTDAGPELDWFAQSNAGLRRTRAIYAIALGKDTPNPFAKESDEEKAQPPQATQPSQPPATTTTVDLEGIGDRIVAFPVPAAEIEFLRTGEAGQVWYIRNTDGKFAIRRYDVTKRKDDLVIAEANFAALTGDGKKLVYRQGNNWFITPAAQAKPGEGRIDLANADIRIDPRAEWAQMLDEAWRINRDYFYATNYHGVDWNAEKAKYAAFLPSLATRGDLEKVIRWMLSELRVGHSYQGPGQRLENPSRVGVGLLGADYEVANGKWRIKRVLGGVNWNPTLRSPLTEPGVNVRAGEYVLAVNGVPLDATTSVYAPFENTVDRSVELTVGPNADGTGSRTVSVVPAGSESALRNRAWIEGNIRKVDSATGGRVAYVYVPNTTVQGYESFKRYFYPQAHKDGIIVDERFNGGGALADYPIDILRRPALSYWATRYGDDLKTPAASIQGPKAMLVDETAGSGGDYLPWMFRKFTLGPLIGQRTWGGLVGILGYPPLMDGGTVTSPNLAIWTPENGFIVENEGVTPDIEVEQTPKDVIAGRDPQLERAISYVMEELRKNPPKAVKRPPYPDKTSRP